MISWAWNEGITWWYFVCLSNFAEDDSWRVLVTGESQQISRTGETLV